MLIQMFQIQHLETSMHELLLHNLQPNAVFGEMVQLAMDVRFYFGVSALSHSMNIVHCTKDVVFFFWCNPDAEMIVIQFFSFAKYL